MSYKFKSRATGDLLMLDATGKQILEILGKTPGEPGILTLEQIPGAISTLEEAVKLDDARRKAIEEARESGDGEKGKEAAHESDLLGAVTLRQRAAPLIDMLRRSAAENKEVIWER